MSCKKNECIRAEYSYTFSKNKKIDTTRAGVYFLTAQINPGTNTVFSYSLHGGSCPNRIDGGGGERLVFEISANTGNFNYANADLQGIECYYQNTTWGGTPDAVKVTQGTLQGNRISEDKWNIKVDLIIPGSGAELSFTKQFSVQ